MTLLVVGATEVAAGKTTFSTGLVAYTDAVGFKPRAGSDFWDHHDQCRAVLAEGRLYGTDATRLAAASPGDLEPEALNPVHRLWQPLPGRTGLLGQKGRDVVVDRVGDEYVVNGTVSVPPAVREALPLSDAAVVGSTDDLNAAIERLYLPTLSSLTRTVEQTERAVVESYAAVARPLRGLSPDAVAVLEPTRARIVDGGRFVQACSIATSAPGTLEGTLEERVPAVLDLVDPAATLELPVLSGDERSDPDALADAYRPAYDELLSVAGWER